MTFVLNAALFAVAWIGHAFWLTVLLNVVYARPFHRKFLRTDRMIVGIMVLSFPIIALWWTGGNLIDCIIHPPEPFGFYLAYCLFVGLGVLPMITAYRCLRRQPLQVLSTSSKIIDIAKELGHRPLGFGQHWRLARIPCNQILEVEFNEKTLALDRLPTAWDGLTILHIGDLHFHDTPAREFFEKVIEVIGQHEIPDLVCMTGDVVDTSRHQRWIKPLLGQLRAREAKLAILGNHDYWCEPDEVRKQLRRAGFTVIGQGPTLLTIRNEPMVIIGHEGPWFPAPCRVGEDYHLDVVGRAHPIFQLLLSHTPDNIRWARNQRVDLMLSGHTHGGQVRIPILGSLFVPSRYSRKYDCGVFWEPPTLLHVSRGISGREPLRWNCRPEVTWLTLRPRSLTGP